VNWPVLAVRRQPRHVTVRYLLFIVTPHHTVALVVLVASLTSSWRRSGTFLCSAGDEGVRGEGGTEEKEGKDVQRPQLSSITAASIQSPVTTLATAGRNASRCWQLLGCWSRR